jgi:hypothetical protein
MGALSAFVLVQIIINESLIIGPTRDESEENCLYEKRRELHLGV